jgi:hypothetical protein
MNRPDAGDSGTELLGPPELDPLPARTPLDMITVRGSTDGARAFSRGPFGTQMTAVLPGGTFCQDIPIDQLDNHIEVFAVGGDGRLSAASAVDVAYDPAAPEPAGGRCSGNGSGGDCEDSEVCGSTGDEDCDGWADDCDLACSGCDDDFYEPNDLAVNVPSLEPGSYPMAICPCRDDWFAFHVAAGARIDATASFSHAELDLDMALFRVNPDGDTGERVAFSTSTNDTESIGYLATAAGSYYMRVFPYLTATKPSGTYQLVIR